MCFWLVYHTLTLTLTHIQLKRAIVDTNTRFATPLFIFSKNQRLYIGDHEAIKFSANIVIKFILRPNLCAHVHALFTIRGNLLHRKVAHKKELSLKMVSALLNMAISNRIDPNGTARINNK